MGPDLARVLLCVARNGNKPHAKIRLNGSSLCADHFSKVFLFGSIQE
jgi:hypothetical protein